jgi:hypothetical protein
LSFPLQENAEDGFGADAVGSGVGPPNHPLHRFGPAERAQ